MILSLLESNKTSIKEFKKYGDVFSRYCKVIRGELKSISFDYIERLMEEIRILKGKQGFRKIFNNTKNIMLEEIRKIHIENIKEYNRHNPNVPYYIAIHLIFSNIFSTNINKIRLKIKKKLVLCFCSQC